MSPPRLFLLTPPCLGALFGLGVIACSKEAPPPPASSYTVAKDDVRLHDGGVLPASFETDVVRLGELLSRPLVTGTVGTVETKTSPSFAPLDGRVERVLVHYGQVVKKGARLALIRSAELANFHKELNAARLSVRTKDALLQRLDMLFKARAAPEKDLLVARSELEEAKLSSATAETRLKSLAIKVERSDRYWMLAPRSGTLVQLAAAPGKQVAPGNADPLATIADLGEAMVLADVPQRDAAGITKGMAVEVFVPGEKLALPGTVEVVTGLVDPGRQTVPVRVRVANAAGRLKIYAFVSVRFPTKERGQVLRVPTIAVVTDGLDSVVFVDEGQGVYRRRQVAIGRQSPEFTEVYKGLKVGERIVTRGALLLLNAVDLAR